MTTPQITSSRPRPDLTVVAVEGAVTADQVRDQIIGFLTDSPTRFVIWDIRNGTLARLTTSDIRTLVEKGAPHAHRRSGGRTAIVSPNDLDYGLSRMFETVAELQHVPFEIHVFRNMDEAESWLHSD